MALFSIHWDGRWRLRACQANPIGWPLHDSRGQRVGRVLDLLADERTRRAVYAVAELDGAPPVLIDLDRLTIDAEHQHVDAALSQTSLSMLSPALWWRRPPAMQRDALAPVASPKGERIIVPVYGERLVIEKRPVVIEEIVIAKTPEVRRETVRTTVRRERAEVRELPVARPEDRRAA